MKVERDATLNQPLARIQPGVATILSIDFQYPSFGHRVQGCGTKWKSFPAVDANL